MLVYYSRDILLLLIPLQQIWSLDGRVVQVLDRTQTLPMTFDPSDRELPPAVSGSRGYASSCVRDVSWHSSQPVILSAAWASHGESTVARHEWKGLSKLSYNLEDWTEKNRAEEAERRARLNRTLPGSYNRNDDDDGEYIATSDGDD